MSESQWFSMIFKPFSNDLWVVLVDSWVILKPFSNDYWMILKCFLSNSWVILSDSQMILWWFSSDSQCFSNHSQMILKQFSVILKSFPSDSQWFLNDSQWFLNNFQMILKLFWPFLTDSQVILVILSDSHDSHVNPHESSQILFNMIVLLFLFLNIYDMWGFMMIHIMIYMTHRQHYSMNNPIIDLSYH